APDVVLVGGLEERLGVLHPQRGKPHEVALDRYRPGVEVRTRPALDDPHLHVVDVSVLGPDAVTLDALDLEPDGLVHRDRAIVEADDREAHAVQAELIEEVAQKCLQSVAAKMLAPESGLA